MDMDMEEEEDIEGINNGLHITYIYITQHNN
jgi:hypothetical protein